jgi:purine-nucleoside phosphorylase
VNLDNAEQVLRDRIPVEPEVFIVLGSGLGEIADGVVNPVEVPFSEIPGLPPAGVAGHDGSFVFGDLAGRAVLMQAGRYHLYEAHPAEIIVAPIRLAARLGAGIVMLSNATGGVHPSLEPGDLLVLDDQINFQWRNPLIGPATPGEPRLPDMSEPFDKELQQLALEAAARCQVPLRKGVYAGLLGPTYETAAEVRMLHNFGADAVGMSTVPEVLAARSAGMRVVAFSVIANQAVGLRSDPLSHEEVLEVVRQAGGSLQRVIMELLPRLPS